MAGGIVAALLIGGVCSTAEARPDEPSSSIRITSPLGRIGTPGQVRIVAQVETPDPATLGPVHFFVDGQLLGVDEDGPPYGVEWTDDNPFQYHEIAVAVTLRTGDILRDSVELEPFEVTEAARVTSVLLEAAVYDADDHFVHGLEAPHFRLSEDGAMQALEMVAQEAVPATFGLLIDSSQSMSRRIGFVRRAAERLAGYLRPDDRVLVAPFRDRIQTVTGPTDDRQTIGEAISAIRTTGGTAILDALVELSERLGSLEGRASIILVTDGYDENSDRSYADALDAVKAAQVTVYVVAIGGVAGISLDGEALLRRIATETGGMAFFPPREHELVKVYDVLAADAQNRYLLGYTPTNQEMDGAWRAIDLTTVFDEYEIRSARAGYFAPAPPPVRPSLEFTVTDTAGRYVDVTVDDLQVIEDGIEQTVDTFQEAVTPVSIVLALDSSGSMVRATESVIEAARGFIEALRPEDALGMILFGDRPVFAHDLSTNRTFSTSAIERYEAVGGTALYDALHDALMRLRREDGRRAVVVVTDGRDEDNPGTGPGSEHTLADVLERLREVGATVYSIGIGPRVGRDALERLAAESGGQAYFPQDVSGLRGEYDRIVENLRRRFVLSYTSTNPTRDGSWRAVEIRPRSENFIAVSSGGYYAPAR